MGFVLCPFGLPWVGVVVGLHPLGFLWGGMVSSWFALEGSGSTVVFLRLVLGGSGEEYPYHLLVVPCPLTVCGARECPHMRTAVEGWEGDCHEDSGNWMLHHHCLGERLEGYCHNRHKLFKRKAMTQI